MAGGIFKIQNKKRPGAYINTVSDKPTADDNDRGVVLLMNGVKYGWGNNGVIELATNSDFQSVLGVKNDDPSLLTIKEALKGATKLLLINSNQGNKASVSDNALPWTITAKYNGEKGNNITIDLIQDAVDNSKVIIKTIFGFDVVDTQAISMDQPDRVENNDFVDFSLIDANKDKLKGFTGQRSVKLQGGTSQDKDSSTQMNLLGDAMQKQRFNVVTTSGIDDKSNIHSLLVEMVKDLRDKQGYKITAVVPYSGTNYDYEAVSVVENGVIMEDETIITPTVAAAYFAGQSASVPLNQSLTYQKYDGAKQSYPALSNEAIIRAIDNGHIVFTDRRDGSVGIEIDINNLVTFTDTKSYQFHKNRELRVLDEIANNTEKVFETQFIGKVTNNEAGRNILKGERIQYFTGLANNNIIDKFDTDDLKIAKGNSDDSITMEYSITPLDSMEKLYNTIKVTR
ncbi:phage tail sheath C-terminal domain-containing protein [Apilactobacillus timberlakei]|uniref:Phage tail protein n=1 Tax=Apilactobacillus timberlakei TaxID=2008380 RepID=A0ABY2YRW1_9LACO|nr:phage tail sheath C-terminal domain-containing protein [Apilactobacillus timberlakei]TPR12397.1 phage tail protein [Apilactobacillus timberlakei]TPR12983.1 phage tail protein [Apilactobacillus timberlakei]